MRNSTQEQFKSNNCCRANERYADRVQIQDEERDKENNQILAHSKTDYDYACKYYFFIINP